MGTVQFLIGEKSWSVEADPQQSLLDHALSQGLPVSYSCRRGDCGQCVGVLVAGEVGSVEPGRPLNSQEGIYLCNALPCGEVVVELPLIPELESIRVVRAPCKIHELTALSADVLQVSLRLPPAIQFHYLPGQYIRLTNRQRITRSYSLAETHRPDKLLRIHVRRIPGGAFSQYLFESARSGDLLHLEGPMGKFVLRSAIVVNKTILLATGTGIAPVHAVLSSLDGGPAKRPGELFLYWGNRRRGDAYFHGPLIDLAQRLKLNYFPVFSDLPDTVGQNAGHVQDLMAKHHPDLSDAQVFASGNAAMVDDARKQSLLLGLAAKRFFSDPFTAS